MCFVSLFGSGPAVPLDAMEAAAAVFPSLARPLQKYLRVRIVNLGGLFFTMAATTTISHSK